MIHSNIRLLQNTRQSPMCKNSQGLLIWVWKSIKAICFKKTMGQYNNDYKQTVYRMPLLQIWVPISTSINKNCDLSKIKYSIN